MGQDLTGWAMDIIKETERLYQKYKKHLDSGFAVFYSPVIQNPDIMLIGQNPGGGPKDFKYEESLQIPEQHEYLNSNENYRLKNEIIQIFNGKLERHLRNSVKLNMLYFRTNNLLAWKEKDPLVAKELEDFCKEKTLETVRRLKPRVIFCEGKAMCFTELVKELNVLNIKKIRVRKPNSSGSSILEVAKCEDGTIILGCNHPTAGRQGNNYNDNYREAIQDQLKKIFNHELT